MKTDRERLEEKIFYSPDGCWYWTSTLLKTNRGVLIPRFRFRSRNAIASRASYVIYKGEIPEGLFVCHHCDNHLCVNPDHLFVGTNRDNIDDMLAKGRSAKGEKSGMSKLTSDQVRQIKTSSITNKSLLGRMFEVHHTTIEAILEGKTWKHI